MDAFECDAGWGCVCCAFGFQRDVGQRAANQAEGDWACAEGDGCRDLGCQLLGEEVAGACFRDAEEDEQGDKEPNENFPGCFHAG